MTYDVYDADHTPYTELINSAAIRGPLRVTPAPYKQSESWRSSSLPACLRTIGYGLLGYAKTHPERNPDYQIAADQGTAIHTRIQEQLVASGMAVAYNGKPAIEVDLVGAPFSGHIDAVIRLESGDLAIFDIKTGYKEFLPGYRYLDDKKQKWAIQLSSYMAYFAMPDGERATLALVYNVHRGDPSVRALYEIPWQPDRWAGDMARIEAAKAAVAAGELPEPEPGACRFCDVRGHCAANTYRKGRS